jgi:hypothetical protein
MKLPSLERVRRPSDVADPLAVSLLFEPFTTVGIGIDWTSVPLAEYSSRKTGAALADKAVTPSPTL